MAKPRLPAVSEGNGRPKSGLFDREGEERKQVSRSKGNRLLSAVTLSSKRHIFGAVNPDDHTNHLSRPNRTGRSARSTYQSPISAARRRLSEYAERLSSVKSSEERERLEADRQADLDTLRELDAVNEHIDRRWRSRMSPEREALSELIYRLVRHQRDELRFLGYPRSSAFTRPRVDNAYSGSNTAASAELPADLAALHTAITSQLRPQYRDILRSRYEHWHGFEEAARQCGFKTKGAYRKELDFVCRYLIELLWPHIASRVQERAAS